ncbi:hypothetical protein AQUCO_02100131v1 [Aquilegia coerulea]|uniref:F-box domain-containing protein n=1 Tax=Aquilegia coerulea TaxID=218851 RepID=A0A2G5DEX9_AQUCA|nr:hypothetical protein AQUCO_02100131v1 [Aquilegia coerulea]
MEPARKKKNINEEEEGKDRISNLPKPILYHILSFLDMKYVVQTSILSNTWRYLWKTIPFLNFDYHTSGRDETHFQSFVSNVLNKREMQNIHFFRLTYDPIISSTTRTNYIDVEILVWLLDVIYHGVQEVYLKFKCESYDMFFGVSRIFRCKSLMTLKLDLVGKPETRDLQALDLPDTIRLPSLKTLHLQSLLFKGNEFMERIFSGCPVLETLVIRDCGLYETENVTICSTRLSYLEINSIYSYGDLYECQITISASNLKSFKCRADYSNAFCLENVSALEYADIGLGLPSNYRDSEELLELSTYQNEKFGREMMKLFGGLHNVKSLRLSALLLERMIESAMKGNYWEDGYFSKCSFHHLKFAEMYDIQGSVIELEFLKVLLMKATPLKKLILVTPKNPSPDNEKRLMNFSLTLLTLPQASSSATIDII